MKPAPGALNWIKATLSEDNGSPSVARHVHMFWWFVVLPVFVIACIVWHDKLRDIAEWVFGGGVVTAGAKWAGKKDEEKVDSDAPVPIQTTTTVVTPEATTVKTVEPVLIPAQSPAATPQPASVLTTTADEPERRPELLLTPAERHFYRDEYVDRYGEAFALGIAFVLDHEVAWRHGEVVSEHVAGDAGGTTKYGIDQRDHPGVNIDRLSEADAVEIYHKTEWTRARCGEYPARLAIALFDCAVNPGMRIIGQWHGTSEAESEDAAIKRLVDLCVAYYKGRSPGLRAKFLAGWLARKHDLLHVLGL